MAVRTPRSGSSTRSFLPAILLLSLLLAASLLIVSSQAATDWPQPSAALVVGGLNSPTHVTSARDGTNRLFVVEKAGRIQFVSGGGIQGGFLDIRSRVLSPGSGQG